MPNQTHERKLSYKDAVLLSLDVDQEQSVTKADELTETITESPVYGKPFLYENAAVKKPASLATLSETDEEWKPVVRGRQSTKNNRHLPLSMEQRCLAESPTRKGAKDSEAHGLTYSFYMDESQLNEAEKDSIIWDSMGLREFADTDSIAMKALDLAPERDEQEQQEKILLTANGVNVRVHAMNRKPRQSFLKLDRGSDSVLVGNNQALDLSSIKKVLFGKQKYGFDDDEAGNEDDTSMTIVTNDGKTLDLELDTKQERDYVASTFTSLARKASAKDTEEDAIKISQEFWRGMQRGAVIS